MNRRANSADSIESLESNPAKFSDDEQPKQGGYDPTSQSQLVGRMT